MAAIDTTGNGVGRWGLLARERIIAKPGFNRWLVPPAALAIHLCIGMAYGFSVFWLPLSRSSWPPSCRAKASTSRRPCPESARRGSTP